MDPQITQIAQITRVKNRKMNANVLTRAMFIVWITAITVLAVIPHSDDGVMVSSNLTASGMEKHLIGYFIAALLCYYAYAKKEDRGRRSPQLNTLKEPGSTGQGGQRSEVVFILLSGLLIFLYSISLEVVQFYLPYRTFNIYDVVGNGVGVLLFVVGWVICGRTGVRLASGGMPR